MTRKTFWVWLLGPLASAQIYRGKPPQPPGTQKFYITIPGNGKDDCHPLVAYGTNRLDALTRCCEDGGLTVWTEAEWKTVEKDLGLDRSCKGKKEK